MLFFVLFSNFYVQEYFAKRRRAAAKRKEEIAQLNGKRAQNGQNGIVRRLVVNEEKSI